MGKLFSDERKYDCRKLQRSLLQESKWLSVTEFQVASSLLFEFSSSLQCVAPFIVSCSTPSSVFASVLELLSFSSIFNNPIADATLWITNASVMHWETWVAKVLWCFWQWWPMLLANTLWFFSPTSMLNSFGLPYLHMSPTMCILLWNVGNFHPFLSVHGKLSCNMQKQLAIECLASVENSSCWVSFQCLSNQVQASKCERPPMHGALSLSQPCEC